MKPPIPWLRVFVEGVVIVGSILLAFGLQAWWEGRQERAEERISLETVLAEFEDNLDRLYVNIEYHARIRGAALSLLSVTAGDAPEPTPAVMDSLLALVFLDAVSFNPARGSVDALLASGRLGIIENEELRVLLASWPGAIEDNSEDEAWIFGDVQERLTPFLNSRMQARNVYSSFEEAADLPELPGLSYADLVGDPQFDNLVSNRVLGEGIAISENRTLQALITGVIGVLRNELGR